MNKEVCLGWAVNISLLVVNLRETNEFANVTLACEHGQQIEAHKVILAASSPFFQNLLKRNRHPTTDPGSIKSILPESAEKEQIPNH
jgi:hypothetical protein